MKFSFYFSLSLFLWLLGCSKDKVIDEDKLVKIYADLLVAQDTTLLTKTTFDSLKQTIFKKYGTTPRQYDSTINYYNQDVKRWESFFNKASAYIDTLNNKKKSI